MPQSTLSKKLAFASADFFGGGSFNIVNFLLPGFLALTVGISPYWIGAIVLIARIWDAVTDPVMGFLSDHTKSPLGKRRIYLIVASPLVLVSMYLLFFPYAFPDVAVRIAAALLSYLLFTTVQTMVMIPYYSLSSEVSSDYQERASFNSYRLGFSIFASILCVAAPGIVVGMFEDKAVGYQVMSLSFGFLFAVSVLMTGLFAREEIQTPALQSKFSLIELAKPLKLKPFRQYLGMFLVLQMSMAVMSGLFFFYADFYVTRSATASGNPSMVGLISAALMFAMQIVALPIYIGIIKKHGKTFAYRLGGLVWIVTAILLFFLPPDTNPLMIYALGALMGLGISGPGLVPHTMYGDVVDAGQLQFKERLDGQMSGFTNFVNKIAQALGLSFVMFLIGLAGFQEKVPGGPDILTQPESATTMIRLIMAITPLVFMGIGILISRKYRLNEAVQAKIRAQIEQGGSDAASLIAEF